MKYSDVRKDIDDAYGYLMHTRGETSQSYLMYYMVRQLNAIAGELDAISYCMAYFMQEAENAKDRAKRNSRKSRREISSIQK
jgi:hypothetical protein